MATIVTRIGKGSALTYLEADTNWTGLNTEVEASTAALATISETIDDRVAALAVAGANMTITYNDVAGTLTFAAAGGGAGTDSFETVSKNLSASDATIAYAGDNIDSITYANGVVKTFSYGVDGLETIVLSGATPGGIDLTKTLQYTLGEFSGFAYS